MYICHSVQLFFGIAKSKVGVLVKFQDFSFRLKILTKIFYTLCHTELLYVELLRQHFVYFYVRLSNMQQSENTQWLDIDCVYKSLIVVFNFKNYTYITRVFPK